MLYLNEWPLFSNSGFQCARNHDINVNSVQWMVSTVMEGARLTSPKGLKLSSEPQNSYRLPAIPPLLPSRQKQLSWVWGQNCANVQSQEMMGPVVQNVWRKQAREICCKPFQLWGQPPPPTLSWASRSSCNYYHSQGRIKDYCDSSSQQTNEFFCPSSLCWNVGSTVTPAANKPIRTRPSPSLIMTAASPQYNCRGKESSCCWIFAWPAGRQRTGALPRGQGSCSRESMCQQRER